MLKAVERVRMYFVQFEDDKVKRLTSWYVTILQRAVDIIWVNTE